VWKADRQKSSNLFKQRRVNAMELQRQKLEAESDRLEQGHRAAARAGIVQILFLRLLTVVTTFCSFVIYSRLLSPKQFGLMAMTNTVFTFVNIFRDFGLAASTIQRPTLTERERSDLFWLNAAATSIGVATLLIAAPLTAFFYGEEEVQLLLFVSAISFFLWGIQSQHAAVLRRNMRFWPVVIAEASGLIAGLIFGIVVAISRRDVWALVGSNLLQAVVCCSVMIAADPWLPNRPGNFLQSTRILSWARDLTIFNMLNYLTSNLGQILVGFKFGALELGRLNRAQQLYTFPNSLILLPLQEIMFPLLSRVQKQPSSFRQYYLTLLRQTTLIFFAIGAVLPVISNDLVAFLLGPSWDETAGILAWFSLAFIAPGFSGPAGLALTCQGRAAELRNWSILDFFFRMTGAFAGLPFGALGVIAGASIAMLFCSTPTIMFLLGRQGPVTVLDQIKVALPSVLVAASAGTAAYVTHQIGIAQFASPMYRLFFECLGAAAVSGLVAMALPQTRHIVLATVRFMVLRTNPVG
jgi:polysaccharide transporter, PST family